MTKIEFKNTMISKGWIEITDNNVASLWLNQNGIPITVYYVKVGGELLVEDIRVSIHEK
jgi:hypothetical protein